MKIIHLVLGKANPERMNGVNKVVHELATRQADAGIDVSVWGIAADTQENYPARTFTTKILKKGSFAFSLPEGFEQSIQNLSDDTIFHIHGGWIPVFYSISRRLTSSSLPFVFTPHGAYNTIAMQKNKWIKKIYFALLEKNLLLKAKSIHHIGQSETLGLSQIYNGQNMTLLPYGFTPDTAVLSKSPDKKCIFGFVGRMDIYTKGLDLILKAFSQLPKELQRAELWIVGDGPERSDLEKMATLYSISDKVVFWGSKFGHEKSEIMSKMDVFIHASRNEGLPASVLEAAAMGIPCIVTEATNIAENITLHEAGIAVKNENTTELNKAMVTMVKAWQHNILDQYSQRCEEMVRRSYSWEVLIPQYQKMYQNALDQK